MVSQIGPEKEHVRRYMWLSLFLIFLHIFFMVYRYGSLPIAPVLGDEVVINDASVSLAQGHGYVASSFGDSQYGLDHVFAHFPPVYPFVQALMFRVFGISVYSLRLTTTLMSIGSSILLFLLMYRLCRLQLINWDLALLINAIFCTNASLITQERVARMESMIEFLVLLSLGFVFAAVLSPSVTRRWSAMAAAGFFGAIALAVHPEAITAILLIAAIMLFVVPVSLKVKVISVASFAAIPFIVGLLVFGPSLFVAIRQFLKIAHDARATEPSSLDWLYAATHHPSAAAMNRNFLLVFIMLLLFAALWFYAFMRGKLERSSLAYRLSASLAAAAVVEILLMSTVFRMDDRRVQFLLAPLLLCYGLILYRTTPFPRWQLSLGGLLVVLQCFVVAAYFRQPHNPGNVDPNRYLAIIRHLPPNASIGTNPGMWLDMKEAGRPFNLIYYGMDGENVWLRDHKNPLDRFDIVILEDAYVVGREWWIEEAQDGRKKFSYTIGTEVVDVYIRNGIPFEQ